MASPRTDEHHSKLHQLKTHRDLAGTDSGAGAPAGRSTYREEYEPDFGPDRDEPVERIESGHEY